MRLLVMFAAWFEADLVSLGFLVGVLERRERASSGLRQELNWCLGMSRDRARIGRTWKGALDVEYREDSGLLLNGVAAKRLREVKRKVKRTVDSRRRRS